MVWFTDHIRVISRADFALALEPMPFDDGIEDYTIAHADWDRVNGRLASAPVIATLSLPSKGEPTPVFGGRETKLPRVRLEVKQDGAGGSIAVAHWERPDAVIPSRDF